MLSNKQQRIYAMSLCEAEKSSMLFKHGCVATCGGKIIAKGKSVTLPINSTFIKFAIRPKKRPIGATSETRSDN